jgi:hypothetical protein
MPDLCIPSCYFISFFPPELYEWAGFVQASFQHCPELQRQFALVWVSQQFTFEEQGRQSALCLFPNLEN